MRSDYIFPLHTLPLTGFDPAASTSHVARVAIAADVISRLSICVADHDVEGLCQLFVEDGNAYWRDILSLTWDYRTFCGLSNIKPFLKDRIGRMYTVVQAHPERTSVVQPFPDVAWLNAFFKFKVRDLGEGLGVLRLVPSQGTETDSPVKWKIQTVFTTLDSLTSFPEKIGALRPQTDSRPRPAVPYANSNPTVIIIGGGHSGLDVAARLKVLDVKTLIVEKGDRIGSSWTQRYDSLTLHDPVWFDHMPYLPFPPNWPIHTSAKKLARWLEFYAEAMELDHWLSSTVTSTKYDTQTKQWTVTVHTHGQLEPRIFTVNHVVFAIGFGSGQISTPTYPGLAEFLGAVKHALEVKTMKEYQNKKVVVIGTGASAHDLAEECVHHGIDVMMVQRGSTHVVSKEALLATIGSLYRENGPPTEIADILLNAMPTGMQVQTGRRTVKRVGSTIDKKLLEGLSARGFLLNGGYMDAGASLTAGTRKGGFYIDTGASQLIIDGMIKLKSGSAIERFTTTGIEFADGTHVDADVVIFATGLGSVRDAIVKICGPEYENMLKPLWDMDEEGELNSVFRDTGVPGLWTIMANFARGRFNSKFMALQIKALEEGQFDGRYSR